MRLAKYGLVAMVAVFTACAEPPMLETLSPDHTCRRTIMVGPPGDPLAQTDAVDGPAADNSLAPVDSLDAVDRGDDAADGGQNGEGPAEPSGSAASNTTIEVEWLTPREPLERQQLNAWCEATGPAVFGGWADASTRAPVALDSIAVISWNVHIGGGDLDRLVSDLREGRLTGAPVSHFVLLLQETHRSGESVPQWRGDFPFGSGDPMAPPGGEGRDIVEKAEALGLSVYYAPSMRSGQDVGGQGSDRGNAILATVPLQSPRAIELPVARQRRVAAVAAIQGITSTGADWALELASVHLENNARGWANDARARVIQAEALLEGLSEDGPAVAAGDINSWAMGPDEAVVLMMLDEFEETPPFPPGPTYVRGFGLVRRYLDYMFFRLPDGSQARYERLPDLYNSDHYPLLGWVVFPTDPD